MSLCMMLLYGNADAEPYGKAAAADGWRHELIEGTFPATGLEGHAQDGWHIHASAIEPAPPADPQTQHKDSDGSKAAHTEQKESAAALETEADFPAAAPPSSGPAGKKGSGNWPESLGPDPAFGFDRSSPAAGTGQPPFPPSQIARIPCLTAMAS